MANIIYKSTEQFIMFITVEVHENHYLSGAHAAKFSESSLKF
jgi:hypothetical protein